MNSKTDTILSDWLSTFSSSDWDSLVDEANRFGYAPTIYYRLLNLTDVTPPAVVLEQLQHRALFVALKNRVHFKELAKVLERFQRASIQVVLLKGSHLAKFIDKDVTLRSMVDLDLLVRQEELPRIPEIFHDLGYKSTRPYWLEDEISTSHHLPIFYKPGKSQFEIHWTIIHPDLHTKIDIDGLWARTRTADFDGMPVRLLAPEDHLLHLCLHCCQDHFKLGLRSLLDISKIVDFYKDDIDWEEVVRTAFQWGASRCVYLVLYLARDLIGVDIQEEFLEALRPEDFQPEVLEWAEGQVFSTPEYTPKLFIRMSGDRSMKEKIKIFFERVFPSRRELSQTYSIPPDSWYILFCFFMHWKDLFVKGLRKGGQLLRQRQLVAARAEREASLINWLGID